MCECPYPPKTYRTRADASTQLTRLTGPARCAGPARYTRRAVTAVLVTACVVSTLRGAPPSSAAAFLPADTPVYIRATGWPRLRAAANHPMWKNPGALGAVVDRWANMVGPGLAKALGADAKQAHAFRSTVQEVVVAAGPGAGQWVVAAQLSNPAPANALLTHAAGKSLLQATPLAGKPAYKTVDAGLPVTIVLNGPLLAMSLTPPLVQGFVQAPASSLAKLGAFASTSQSPLAKGEVWIYINRPKADALLGSYVAPGGRPAYQKWQQALSLTDAGVLVVGISHTGPVPVTTVRWQWASAKPHLQALAKPGGAPTLALHVPRQVVSAVWVSTAPGPGGWTALRTVLQSAEAALPVKPMTTLAGQWEALSGAPIPSILPKVRELCLVELAGEPKAPAALKTVAVLKCASPADANALGLLLRQAAQKATKKAPTSQASPGKTLWTWTGVNVQPTMTVQGDRLVVGLHPKAVLALANVAAPQSLGTDPTFQQHAKRLGAGAQMFCYARASACFVGTPNLVPVVALLKPAYRHSWAVKVEPNALEVRTTLPLDLCLLAAVNRLVPP